MMSAKVPIAYSGHLGLSQDWQHMLLEASCLVCDVLLQSKTGRMRQAAWTQSTHTQDHSLHCFQANCSLENPGACLRLL